MSGIPISDLVLEFVQNFPYDPIITVRQICLRMEFQYKIPKERYFTDRKVLNLNYQQFEIKWESFLNVNLIIFATIPARYVSFYKIFSFSIKSK